MILPQGAVSIGTQLVSGLMLNDGQVFDTNFVLASAASVQGQVTGNGQPLTDAMVFFTDASSNVTSAPSDINGDFVATGLSAGAPLPAQAPGFGL